jgi:hypothetical protein
MNSHVKAKVTSILTATLAIVVMPVFAEIPDGVSPGAVDRIAEIERRCPTFIWDSVPGAAFHELVGYRIPDDTAPADLSAIDLAEADQVLYAKVTGSAPAWEPELAECLAPGGNYVWFVRAVFREDEGELAEASEWSFGRFFSISPMPSAREVEEALSVLRRYVGQADSGVAAIDPQAREAVVTSTGQPAPSQRQAVPPPGPKSVTSAKTAIRGSLTDTTGETYGVVGVSNSPGGAGLGAANSIGGADLVLDGSADGEVDAIFTQGGVDRPSPSEQWFSLMNSDTGVLSLNVEGTIVGDGSGLTAVDADTLGGQAQSAFAIAAHDHFGDSWSGSTGNGLFLNSSDSHGLYAVSSGGGHGVYGQATGSSVNGVYGHSGVSGGRGVYGWASASSSTTWGVYGVSSSTSGNGVFGAANAGSGTTYGVHGQTFSPNGRGVFGEANAASGTTSGVFGQTASTGGWGVYGVALASTGENYGVYGRSDSSAGVGVAAVNTAGGIDLLLDGSQDGETDTTLWQWGIDRASSGIETFTVTNSIGGSIDLSVHGQVSAVNLAGDGALLTAVDAETLDGLDSTAFSATGHLHDGRYYTESELNTSGGGGAVHWLNLTNRPAGLDDGDDDTTYTIGPGLVLEGGQIRLDAAAFSTKISTLDSTGAVGFHNSIAIGDDGLGLISYYDGNPNSDLKVAHCDNSDCSTASTYTLDSTGYVGEHTSIAIGDDGLGLISYRDASNGDLKVAHCDDTDCTTASTYTLDSTGDVGAFTSIAIGDDGLGLISYYDGAPNNDLKVAHCDDTDCSSATTYTLDSTGAVGRFTSIAIGDDGLGLISYQDGSNGDLKVEHLHPRQYGRCRGLHLDSYRRRWSRPYQLPRQWPQQRPQGGALQQHRLHQREYLHPRQHGSRGDSHLDSDWRR